MLLVLADEVTGVPGVFSGTTGLGWADGLLLRLSPTPSVWMTGVSCAVPPVLGVPGGVYAVNVLES